MNNFNEKVSFIWSVADLLRGPYRPNQYKDIMLPLTVLRRLDCVLEPTKEEVIKKYKTLEGSKITNPELILNRVAGQSFHNTSHFTFEKLKGDPDNIAANLTQYIKSFSNHAREIIEHFGFEEHIAKLEKADRLYQVVAKFCEIDLHPDKVSNIEMGYIFEELIRRFNEASNEEAGDHFTPREVIRLMVNLIFAPDNDTLTTKGIVKTLYDPAAGTGGMLSVSEEYLRELNPDAKLEVFAQDYNPQSYAICGSDMMIKGESLDNIRFGAGLPRINDGSFLFLQHMISKRKEREEGGTRLAIVFNGSPLFTGAAGSGESDIRKWIIESDWLDAVVALPDQLFYNTDISTYLFIVTNRKEKERRGKIQLIDATGFFLKMRKSLGNKRNEIGDGRNAKTDHIGEITRLYCDFTEGEYVKIFDNTDFGYQRITVERPLRLNFMVNDERLGKIRETKQFVSLATSKKRKDTEKAEAEIAEGKKMQQSILDVLDTISSSGIVKNRDEFTKLMKKAFRDSGLNLPAPLFKAILMALSERDETADLCTDKNGNPEPDSQLRDYENVPLKENIAAYMAREVLPHVPDAWVDESKTKIGYEINFNRHFYKYTPPRPLEEIEGELKGIEREIAGMLEEMV